MKAYDKIGVYTTLEEQERPGVGALWRAADIANGQIKTHVLIDLVDAAQAQSPGFAEHFVNQSQVVAKLEHPNILRELGHVNQNGQLGSVYEFHEGFSLARVLERCQNDMYPFTIDHALLVVSKLLSALAYAKGKHLPHGFVNPTQVYVTHEGEIKLKGFALSSALRAGGKPALSEKIGKYVPAGMNPLGDDRDRLDIYACAAILYEMLVGEAFAGGNAAEVIKNARTDADSEPIPGKIATMLVRGLDGNRPDSYRDIQRMAKDMDELLFSGEYSPTTFNLAFFMHSAFRDEMDGMSEKVKTEKTKKFEAAAPAQAPPPKRAAAAAAAPKPPQRGGASEVKPRPAPASSGGGGKSMLPMILGAVALVLVTAVVTTIINRSGQTATETTGTDDRFAQQKERLMQEGQTQMAESERQNIANLTSENRILREENRQLREAEKQRQIKLVQEEMERINQRMAQVKDAKNRAAQQAEAEKEMEELRKRNEALQEQERQAREELLASQQKAVEEALAEAERQQKAQEAEEAAANPEASEPEEIAAESTPVAADPEPVKPKEQDNSVPVQGQIVDMNDELLEKPVVLEGYETLDAPRRAVRDGLVGRDQVISFILRVLVNENGRVEDVEVFRNPVSANQDDHGMVDRARRAAQKIRYSEPTKMGVGVKVWVFLPIHFKGK